MSSNRYYRYSNSSAVRAIVVVLIITVITLVAAGFKTATAASSSGGFSARIIPTTNGKAAVFLCNQASFEGSFGVLINGNYPSSHSVNPGRCKNFVLTELPAGSTVTVTLPVDGPSVVKTIPTPIGTYLALTNSTGPQHGTSTVAKLYNASQQPAKFVLDVTNPHHQGSYRLRHVTLPPSSTGSVGVNSPLPKRAIVRVWVITPTGDKLNLDTCQVPMTGGC